MRQRPAPILSEVRRSGALARRLRMVVLILGFGLMSASILSSIANGREAARRRLDGDLRVEASLQSAALSDYFEHSRSVARLLAENPVFDDFYLASSNRLETISAGGPLMDDVHDALAFVEELYPGQISEVCFIDLGGAENARVVHGERAATDELSPNESANEFFHHTVNGVAGQVIQSAPYISPDTGVWVVSNSTPIAMDDGTIRSLVHFEVAIESFRDELSPVSDEFSAFAVDTESATVIIDSRHPGELGEAPEASDEPSFASLIGRGGSAGSLTLGDQRLAIEPVDGGPDNQNSWMVVVAAPVAASMADVWTARQISMSALALLLVLVSLWTMWLGEQNSRRAAGTDSLTGLANRRSFDERIEHMLRHENAARGAVILIDLDRFKEVNDTYGHRSGDELLRIIAARLRGCVRSYDTVARLGGDEFGILINDATGVSAAEVADRIGREVRMQASLGDCTVVVGASVGVALAATHSGNVDSLLHDADLAMYQAKQLGRLGDGAGGP